MKKQEIHLDDWKRILFGNAPTEFMLEVLLRSVIIILAFILVVRLMGKRMNGQLTITEMAVMVSLGAIISPIMQLPDRGILLGLLVLACALLFQRGLTWLDFKSTKVEEVTQGKEIILIEDGILQLDAMASARISKQQIFATLRGEKIHNIQKVKRLYLEACGLFSIYTEEEEKPGLSLFPTTDEEVHQLQHEAGHDLVACMNCGKTIETRDPHVSCPVCHEVEWTQAVC